MHKQGVRLKVIGDLTAFNAQLPALIASEVISLLLPVKNANALAGAIKRLHLSPELAPKYCQAARVRALQEFDERIVIGQTLAVYSKLLGRVISLLISLKTLLSVGRLTAQHAMTGTCFKSVAYLGVCVSSASLPRTAVRSYSG